METLNTIEKMTLLVSTGVVFLANLFVMLERIKKSEKKNGNNLLQKLIAINPKINNRMMKTTLIITLFLNSFLVNAQDTIYFKNKTIVPAKITEVGISEIKYQRLDNLTGPNYLSTKSEILLIKYSNGVTDSITNIASEPMSLNYSTKNLSSDKIQIVGRKLIYNGATVSDAELSDMINRCENPEKKTLLTAEYKKMKRYKANQRLYPPLIFVTSFVVLIGTSPLVTAPEKFSSIGYSEETLQLAGAGIIGAALTRITGFVVNKVNQNKRWNKRNEIALMYNNFN